MRSIVLLASVLAAVAPARAAGPVGLALGKKTERECERRPTLWGPRREAHAAAAPRRRRAGPQRRRRRGARTSKLGPAVRKTRRLNRPRRRLRGQTTQCDGIEARAPRGLRDERAAAGPVGLGTRRPRLGTFAARMYTADGSRRRRGRVAATPWPRRGYSVEASRGDAADGSRRRCGRDVDIPWRRIAATPWTGRGHSVETAPAGTDGAQPARPGRHDDRGDPVLRVVGARARTLNTGFGGDGSRRRGLRRGDSAETGRGDTALRNAGGATTG